MDINIDIPKPFSELFKPYRYKAYYGGRGGAKSQSFARALLLLGSMKPLRILCCREIQKSIKDSVKRLFDDLIEQHKFRHYSSTETEIRGKNGTLIIFLGLKSNPEQIKSMEGVDIAWVEEANRVSQRSLDLLIPTIRKDASEIWFSWNPVNDFDPVDMMFRSKVKPPNSYIRQVNFNENIFFPHVLKEESEFMRVNDPQKYSHVWLGGYNDISEGAYFSAQFNKALQENRIRKVLYDENLEVYTSFDLGWNDNTAIWFFQLVGNEIRVIDYVEDRQKKVSEYANMLRMKQYNYAPLILPHDAYSVKLESGTSTAEIFKSLGFKIMFENGKLAPKIEGMNGINIARSVFDRMYFDIDNCKEGIKALKAYHEKWDDSRNIGIGANHDWSSHGATAFIYFCMTLMNPSFNNNNVHNEQELVRAQNEYMYANNNNLWNPFDNS